MARVALAIALLAACAHPHPPSPAAPRPATPAATPATPAAPSTADAGTLELTLKGKPFGTETFSIERDADGYVLRSEVQLTFGSAMRLMDGELRVDAAWKPKAGRFRDVKDGGTISVLAGAPLVLRGTAPFAPPSERTASRDIELFLADNTMSHFAPLCAIAAPAVRVGFPGMDVTVGADRGVEGSALTRRRVDLGGTMRVLLACERGLLVGVEVPLVGLKAVRPGRAAEVDALAEVEGTKPALAEGLIEAPRTVRVRASRDGAEAELACSLVRPAASDAGARPAVILLTGSGAQDRDGDAVGPGGVKSGLLKVLASALGEAGVVSLRCDDRGTAASTGTYGEATLDTFIGDAAAMLAALRREPGVDRRRLVVIGHSEGALVATHLAARERRGVARIALLAGPGRDVDVVLLEQIERTLTAAGLTPEEVAVALAHHREAFAAIRAGASLPETAEAREWAGGEAWLRSHFKRDVLATAATLDRVGVLVAQGEVDRQVTTVDATALVTAFRAGGNPDVTLARYASLDHNFAHSETGAVADYVDGERAIDRAFVADVVAFVTRAR
ncbi:MAG TPA: alpha/beta hydrolase [Kofleriaceae bacterium]|nr:alpha/beta hydrolase [Kofleriaceae bacterium]